MESFMTMPLPKEFGHYRELENFVQASNGHVAVVSLLGKTNIVTGDWDDQYVVIKWLEMLGYKEE